MINEFKASDVKELRKTIDYFNDFHDDYVDGIKVKFEDYKALNDKGESIGIRDAKKSVILMINTKPYRKDHENIVQVEFINVKSFDISSTQDVGPKWGILGVCIGSDGDDIIWDIYPICTGAIFKVISSKVIVSYAKAS